MTRRDATLGQALRRAIVRAIVITAALAVGYGVTSHLVTMTRPPSGDVMAERPTADGSPSAAMAEAEARGLVCWTRSAPSRYAEAIPTHVVWQHVDGRTVVSSRLVGPALETLFADGTLEGRAVAFCHTTR